MCKKHRKFFKLLEMVLTACTIVMRCKIEDLYIIIEDKYSFFRFNFADTY